MSSNRYNILARSLFSDQCLADLKRILGWMPSMGWLPDGRWSVEMTRNGSKFRWVGFHVSFD